jgi:mycothiol synthase
MGIVWFRGGMDAPARREILRLAESAEVHDGAAPVSEASRLALEAGDPGWRHALARTTGRLTGYAAVDPGFSGVELVVAPAARHQGTGRRLAGAVAQLARRQGLAEVRFWAHGDLAPGAALAASLGARRSRELLSMRRPLQAPASWIHRGSGAARPAPGPDRLSEQPCPWRLREFVPGDEAAWVALNAAAFATHPEQGRLTELDLARRIAQPWYAPGDLLLAEVDGAAAGTQPEGRICGYVWVKATPPGGSEGEIYAIGVHPAFQGSGLGTALMGAGLRRLAERGARAAMLYVEGDSAAVRLYRRLGFAVNSTDAQYSWSS